MQSSQNSLVTLGVPETKEFYAGEKSAPNLTNASIMLLG